MYQVQEYHCTCMGKLLVKGTCKLLINKPAKQYCCVNVYYYETKVGIPEFRTHVTWKSFQDKK